MKVLKMTRTNGILLAISNVLVRQSKIGNFVVQMNTVDRDYPSSCEPEYWMEGYTDTGYFVTSDFWLKWEKGSNHDLAEARVLFGYSSDGSICVKVFDEFTFGYSPEQGIFIRP